MNKKINQEKQCSEEDDSFARTNEGVGWMCCEIHLRDSVLCPRGVLTEKQDLGKKFDGKLFLRGSEERTELRRLLQGYANNGSNRNRWEDEVIDFFIDKLLPQAITKAREDEQNKCKTLLNSGRQMYERGKKEERERILNSLPRTFWEDEDHSVGGYISKKDLKNALSDLSTNIKEV